MQIMTAPLMNMVARAVYRRRKCERQGRVRVWVCARVRRARSPSEPSRVRRAHSLPDCGRLVLGRRALAFEASVSSPSPARAATPADVSRMRAQIGGACERALPQPARTGDKPSGGGARVATFGRAKRRLDRFVYTTNEFALRRPAPVAELAQIGPPLALAHYARAPLLRSRAAPSDFGCAPLASTGSRSALQVANLRWAPNARQLQLRAR